MEIEFQSKEFKNDIYDVFLIIPNELKKFLNMPNVYWVYKIYDIQNDKVYIGKTKNIKIRAKDYINAYLRKEIDCKIVKAMLKYGIHNFVMSPIEVASNNTSACIKETYYIDYFNATDDKHGYNISKNSYSLNGNNEEVKHKSRKVTLQNIAAKMSKSKLIAGINYEKKEVVVSLGLKLFGDYINRGKDEIKSAAKRETLMEGYFLYYLNDIDFKNQIECATYKLEKNSIYSSCNNQYSDYIRYGKLLREYLLYQTSIEDFDIFFICQDPNKLYAKKDVKEFFEFYDKLTNKIN